MGRILRKQLTLRGYKVVCEAVTHAPRLFTTKCPVTQLHHLIQELDYVVECRAADLADAKACEGLFEGCGAVIHLAALPKPSEPYDAIHANNMTTDHNVLAEAARTT
eukprot:gene3840-biopygen3747